MEKHLKKSLQSIKFAASQSLRTRIVKSKKHFTRIVKHKATKFSDDFGRFFIAFEIM
jgi:hypothetical protein